MNLTDNDYELLSAYLDGMLADDELHTLEGRLHREPDLQRELQGLQQMVALLRGLPRRKAPRSFALTPEMVAQSVPPGNVTAFPRQPIQRRNIIPFPVISIFSAVASLILTLAGLGLLLSAMSSENTAGSSMDNNQETVGMLSNSTLPDEVAFGPTTEPTTTETELRERAADMPEMQITGELAQQQINETALGYVMTPLGTGTNLAAPGDAPAPPQLDTDTSMAAVGEQPEDAFTLAVPSPSPGSDRSADIVAPSIAQVTGTSPVAANIAVPTVGLDTQESGAEEVPGEAPGDNTNEFSPEPLVMEPTLAVETAGEVEEEAVSADLYDEEFADDTASAMVIMPTPQPTQKPEIPATGGNGGFGGAGGGMPEEPIKPTTPAPAPGNVPSQQSVGTELVQGQSEATERLPTATALPTATITLAPIEVAVADGSGGESSQPASELNDVEGISTGTLENDTRIDDQIALGGVLLALGGLLMAFTAFMYLRQRSA